jgi:hypothetical protein
MTLPDNAVVLGKGGTFLVPIGGFNGWMRVDDDPWVEDHCSGKTSGMEYAAPVGSEVWKLNTPDLWNGLVTTVQNAEELRTEIAARAAAHDYDQMMEKSVWMSAMPTPTEEQLNDSMVGCVGPMQILPPDMHIEQTPLNQSDPHGIPQHAPGAKNDNGKMMAGLVLNFPRSLWAVGAVGTYGARKYTRDGWEHVPDGIQRYHDAEMRHLLLGKMEEMDQESGMPHEWHRVWNALASLELKLRAKEAE